MTRRTAVSLFSCALNLPAADPWKEKEPGQWSDADVKKLISKSPWAKEITVEMGGGGMGGGG
ncbi:MAG: hypothetical protein FJW39_33380, partial [Acidobacteria bacterium]|nr:hypothetical protein [Acidobacteriota bacterium]